MHKTDTKPIHWGVGLSLGTSSVGRDGGRPPQPKLAVGQQALVHGLYVFRLGSWTECRLRQPFSIVQKFIINLGVHWCSLQRCPDRAYPRFPSDQFVHDSTLYGCLL